MLVRRKANQGPRPSKCDAKEGDSSNGSLLPQKIKMIVLAGASPHEAW